MPLAITDSKRVKEMGGTDATPAAQPTPAQGQEATQGA